MPAKTDAQGVLDFWFEELPSEAWYTSDPAIDARVSEALGRLAEQALAGEVDQWAETSDGALALIILLDQAPRNIYRGTPHAFSGDAKALGIAREMVANGRDMDLEPRRRAFVYHPHQHAEDLEAQEEGVHLCESHLPETSNMPHYAKRHRDVIARFGRFPHRNVILGRKSTPEESAYLAHNGETFGG